MRAARSNNSSSATAVLQSLLALSSLHRYGVQSQAMRLKISSLKALAAASVSKNSLDLEQVTQHVAAGMLLCSFEVSVQPSCRYCDGANVATGSGPPIFLHVKPMGSLSGWCEAAAQCVLS